MELVLGAILVFAVLALGMQTVSNGTYLTQASNDLASLVEGNLSAQQIAGYARQAGFSGNDLVTATAIALAESGGNPNAYNPETKAGAPDGMGSYGLWQIYLYKHPEFTGWDLYDPAQNALAAYEVYSAAGGFQPWATYGDGNGVYQTYLESASQGVNA
jgi:hypothetical protein